MASASPIGLNEQQHNKSMSDDEPSLLTLVHALLVQIQLKLSKRRQDVDKTMVTTNPQHLINGLWQLAFTLKVYLHSCYRCNHNLTHN